MIYHFNTKLNSGGSGKYFDLLLNIRDDQIFIGLNRISILNILNFVISNYQLCRDPNHIKVFHSQLTLFIMFVFCRGRIFFIPHGIVNGARYQWAFRNIIQFILLRFTIIEVIGCGDDEYEKLLALIGQHGKKRAYLVRNPAIKQDKRLSIRSHKLLFCGPAIPQKGLDRLINLVPESYQGRCDVITSFTKETTYAREIRSMLSQSQICVLPPQKITPLLLSNYKALIVCSRFEGLPFLVLEALSSGLPVILPNTPGCAELARYAGVICYDLNQFDLSKELKRLNELPAITQDDIAKIEKIYSINDFNAFWSALD